VGFREEAKTLTRLLETNGFRVSSVCCKTGAVPKEEAGISDAEKVRPGTAEMLCNPLAQADLLNRDEVEFTFSLGQCVGHDAATLQHIQGPAICLVAKDRVLAHNTVAALDLDSRPRTFRAIGYVENGLPFGTPRDTLVAAESRITLSPEYAPGLTGLEKEPRVLVVFLFHRSQGWEMEQHPRGDETRPKRGVFALRSPRRPNRVGVTEVELLGIRENVLTVRGLDAVDGTPVLDLKPA
jgi:tRNA-Thr(GGU) m(6)t(6)A37 methyltransferase TsaA